MNRMDGRGEFDVGRVLLLRAVNRIVLQELRLRYRLRAMPPFIEIAERRFVTPGTTFWRDPESGT